MFSGGSVRGLAHLTCVALLVPFGAQAAWGRFELHDADQIDTEERYNTETYNDKLSYRSPFDWDDLWASYAAGFRVNAGSLNATRFDYQEDIKFSFNSDWAEGPVGFGFFQTRREDVVEKREDRVVRVNWRLFDLLTLAVMGDGGVDKEYGDLGGALGLWLGPNAQGEFYYWSVDHFYSTKKEAAGDHRSRRAQSVGTRGAWQSGPSKVLWHYEYDLPLSWHRDSSGYDYANSRRAGMLRLEVGELSAWRGFAQADVEAKSEEKVWEGTANEQSKSLQRRSGVYELGMQRRTATGHDQAAGLVHIERFAKYAHGARSSGAVVAAEDLFEPRSPDSSTRSEAAWYLTDYSQLSGRHYGQLGLHTSHVLIREGGDRRAVESKFQAAWDYRFHERVRALLNTTWDIDQIGTDYPYGKKRPFRPWGGGDIQFIAVF